MEDDLHPVLQMKPKEEHHSSPTLSKVSESVNTMYNSIFYFLVFNAWEELLLYFRFRDALYVFFPWDYIFVIISLFYFLLRLEQINNAIKVTNMDSPSMLRVYTRSFQTTVSLLTTIY